MLFEGTPGFGRRGCLSTPLTIRGAKYAQAQIMDEWKDSICEFRSRREER